MGILKFSQYFKERNVKLGLIFFVIASTVAYIVLFPFFSGLFLYADIQFVIGASIGVIYGLILGAFYIGYDNSGSNLDIAQ